MSWQIVKLGDIATCIQPGPFGSQLHRSDYSEEGTPIIMPKDMDGGVIKHDSLVCVSDEHIKRLQRHQVHAGNIMFARKGDVTKCVYITEKEDGCLTGSDCLKVALNHKKCYSKYIYYQLRSPVSRKWLERHSIGATMPSLNTPILSSIEIRLPDLPAQRRIASILSAYDDLIENNRRQIKLLEEAAHRLYREWFVELRFPGHEGVKIVAGAPEGWRKVKVQNICLIKTGKRDANFGSEDGVYPFFTCARTSIKAPSYSFDCSAIILAGNGDFNLRLYRGKFEAYQRTYVLSPMIPEYLYLLFNAVRMNMSILSKGASGSTIKFLTKGMIDSIVFLIPTECILAQYNENCEAIQNKIEKLQRSISLLDEARNLLLPKIMSRETEV